MTTIFYNRYFDRPTASPGTSVTVTIEISFISPLVPDVNFWFDNVGDNLGGSKSTNGPFNYGYESFTMTTNLLPSAVQKAAVGETGALGCLRLWANGSTYPSPTSPFTEVWKPINPLTLTKLVTQHVFSVKSTAVLGTVITLPTRVTPTDNSNYDANKMMIDLGSSAVLHIEDGSVVGSRTLTIVRNN